MSSDRSDPLRVAVIGGGVSGLSAAWLLAKTCDVTLYEAESRLGGHCDTFDWDGAPVDCGFIVYNERTYPNLTALFAHLGVPTRASDMSFAVSIDEGLLEYSGSGLRGLVAQPANLLRPGYWSMLSDMLRFFREARKDVGREDLGALETYLDRRGYGQAFRDCYLYPMAAAVWSTPAMGVGEYPAENFIRFSLNHGLSGKIKLIPCRPAMGTEGLAVMTEVENPHFAGANDRARAPSRGLDPRVRLLTRLLGSLRYGRLSVTLPSGQRFVRVGADSGLEASLVLRRWRALWHLLIGGEIGFAQAWIDGDCPDARLRKSNSSDRSTSRSALVMIRPRLMACALAMIRAR